MMTCTFPTRFTLPLVVIGQVLISKTVMLLKLLVTIYRYRQITDIGKTISKYGVCSKIDQELNYLN